MHYFRRLLILAFAFCPALALALVPAGTALFSNTCYADVGAARFAACSAYRTFSQVGAVLYSSECVAQPADDVMALCSRVNGGACVSISQPWPNMPACGFDGGTALPLDLFALAMGFLVIIWGGKKLADLFDTSTIE